MYKSKQTNSKFGRVKITMIFHFRLIDMDQPTTLCSDFSFSRYNDLSVFNKWLDKLLKRYPDVVTDYVYGKSYENRPLRAVKVSHRPVC